MLSTIVRKIHLLHFNSIRSNSLFPPKTSFSSCSTFYFNSSKSNLRILLKPKVRMITTSLHKNVNETDRNVFVQLNTDKNMMTISFVYENENKTKQFNLQRRATEPLSLSLERIKLNLSKLNKRDKKQKSNLSNLSDQQTIGDRVDLTINGSIIDSNSTENIAAWIEGAILELDGIPYVIRTNCPGVETLALPDCIMKKFLTMPHISTNNCEIKDCLFAWYRKLSAQQRALSIQHQAVDEANIEFDDNSYWYKVSNDLIYCPVDEDVGHLLRITCSPSDGVREGLKISAVSRSPVEMGPNECPFEKRHLHTSDRLQEKTEFRMVTYNILADLYADSHYSRSVLFKHCASFALDIDYRRQLLLKEILGYRSDLICLQEVDRKEFIRTFDPVFTVVGKYSGIFNTKGGQVGEGLATFYKDDRFELVDSHITLLSDLIEPRDLKYSEPTEPNTDTVTETSANKLKVQEQFNSKPHPILDCRESTEAKQCLSNFAEIRSAILSNLELKRRFLDRHSVLQTSLLRVKGVTNAHIIVANTHLYFAPDADHVRLLQGSVCVKYLEYIKSFYKKSFNLNESDSKISIIFCGDMNSTPDCGIYKLLLSGKIGSQLPDWSSNANEAVIGLTVETKLRFKSAYQDIDYTNYTPEFNGCLDYIYYESDDIQCESTVPLPSHEEVIETGGIPSQVFPSDHLALIANFKLLD